MEIWIDPNFKVWLPLVGFILACYISFMLGEANAASRLIDKLKQEKKDTQ